MAFGPINTICIQRPYNKDICVVLSTGTFFKCIEIVQKLKRKFVTLSMGVSILLNSFLNRKYEILIFFPSTKRPIQKLLIAIH